jgi:hypothetical protein
LRPLVKEVSDVQAVATKACCPHLPFKDLSTIWCQRRKYSSSRECILGFGAHAEVLKTIAET